MIIRKCVLFSIALMLAIGFSGCKKSDTAGSGTSDSSSGAAGASGDSGGDAQVSGLALEAQNAVMADLAKHWSQGPDGWTTALVGGSAYAPEHYLRQAKDLVVASVNADDLSEADKLNGVQWSGSVMLKPLTMREVGDPAMVAEGMSNPSAERQKGKWSVWVEYQTQSVNAQKVNGQWQISDGGTLRAGTIPTPDDFANAGIQ